MSAEQSTPIMRPGDALLTVYLPRRRWFGRRQSRWTLEWRYGQFDGGEYSLEIASGWTAPSWELREFRLAGEHKAWLL